jgi:hypothetical protein
MDETKRVRQNGFRDPPNQPAIDHASSYNTAGRDRPGRLPGSSLSKTVGCISLYGGAAGGGRHRGQRDISTHTHTPAERREGGSCQGKERVPREESSSPRPRFDAVNPSTAPLIYFCDTSAQYAKMRKDAEVKLRQSLLVFECIRRNKKAYAYALRGRIYILIYIYI